MRVFVLMQRVTDMTACYEAGQAPYKDPASMSRKTLEVVV